AVVLLIAVLFKIAPWFDRLFERFTNFYERGLRYCLSRKRVIPIVLGVATVFAVWCFPRIGQELFPEVDSSEFTVHVRVAGGPRVEVTEDKVRAIEGLIREVVEPDDLEWTLANIGISSRWSAIYTSNNGPHSAFVRVQLRSGFDGRSTPTMTYVEELR